MSDRPEPRSQAAPAPAPNYAARRMLASTIGITLVVTLGLLVWRFTHDEPSSGPGADDGWNTIALIERGNGDIVLVDRGGTVTARFAGATRVVNTYARDGLLALAGSTSVSILNAATDVPDTVDIGTSRTITRLPTSADSLWLAAGSRNGGNIVLIDVGSPDGGYALDIGAIAEQTAPRLYAETIRNDADGTVFALADAANFQTIVVRAGFAEPLFFPAQPLAVAKGLVVTSQVVGQQAEITLYDFDRTKLASVPSALPAGAVIDVGSERVTLVGVDGAITRFDKGDKQATAVGAIVVPSGDTVHSVHPIGDGSRLVVVGDTFEALVTIDGATLFSSQSTDQLAVPPIEPDWACLPAGGGDTFTALVSIDDGSVLADLTGIEVTGVAGDGCTVIGSVTAPGAGTRPGASSTSSPTTAAAGTASTTASTPVVGTAGTPQTTTVVVSASGRLDLGATRTATLAPDGRAVVRRTTTGRLELVAIDDGALGDVTDLTAVAPVNVLVAFLAR